MGLPGGVKSPYFKLLQDANVNGMELREGKGNVYEVRLSLDSHRVSCTCLASLAVVRASAQLPDTHASWYTALVCDVHHLDAGRLSSG